MQKITKLYHNQPGETSNQTNLHLEPHIYPIYYVNIDLRHQYGISVAKSQTFLLAKRPCWPGARRNGCICRLWLTYRYQNNVWVKPSVAHLYQNIGRVGRVVPPPPPFPSRMVFDPFFYQQAMMIHKKVLKIGNGTELAWEKICFR